MPFAVVSWQTPPWRAWKNNLKTSESKVPSFFALTIAFATALHPIIVPNKFVLSTLLAVAASVLNSSEECVMPAALTRIVGRGYIYMDVYIRLERGLV